LRVVQDITLSTTLAAWNATAAYIAHGHSSEFLGRQKEGLVFCHLKQEIQATSCGVNAELEVPFDGWEIDLVASGAGEPIAVEGKFKIRGDGAVPDNRKAAFFDLYKLERYVRSGKFAKGLFVWLTDEEAYLREPKGDSADFSTHHGRRYRPGTPLHARRSRNQMPLPLVLAGEYNFTWERIGGSPWYVLVVKVLSQQANNGFQSDAPQAARA
jgi:hypothetical protein